MDGFQSTHPSWGATTSDKYLSSIGIEKFQSTHPSWGATTFVGGNLIPMLDFNPRTHRGVRQKVSHHPLKMLLFQSTHPSWGATATV